MYVPVVPDAFEFFMAFLCMLSGAPMALGGPRPNSIEKILPPTLRVIWGLMLLFGGVLVIIGLSLRKRDPSTKRVLVGIRVEGAGLLPLAAGAFTFSLVIPVSAGWAGAFASGTYLAFGLACLGRAAEIKVAERGILTAVTAPPEVNDDQ